MLQKIIRLFLKKRLRTTEIFRKADAGVPLFVEVKVAFLLLHTVIGNTKNRSFYKLKMTPLEAQPVQQNAAMAMSSEDALGLISPGYKADLLVIDGDPSKDVSILGNKELIKYVIFDGKEVDLTPAPERIKDPAGWRISSTLGRY